MKPNWLASLLLFLFTLLASMKGHGDPATTFLDALVRAYPDQLSHHDGERIYWRDGSSMQVTDGNPNKSFEQLLRQASIADQFRSPYPRGSLNIVPAFNADPGRFRNEPFFLKMYGDCRTGEMQSRLVRVAWLPKSWGGSVTVTNTNGVADKLRAVSAEIDELEPSIKQAAYPVAGGLACRSVRDTGRLSMHAFGTAIDLNLAFADYWLAQRSHGGEPLTYRNRMPLEIVDIFERHGFIWGGKWYHYDTMHFEYRPELLDTGNR
jgi:hypothetical protein